MDSPGALPGGGGGTWGMLTVAEGYRLLKATAEYIHQWKPLVEVAVPVLVLLVVAVPVLPLVLLVLYPARY